VLFYRYLFRGKFFFKNNQKVLFPHWNFLVFLPLDPDPDSQYGSGSTKSLNPDPIRIRIHNPAENDNELPVCTGKWYYIHRNYQYRYALVNSFWKITAMKGADQNNLNINN
jgi:hypothetical protein